MWQLFKAMFLFRDFLVYFMFHCVFFSTNLIPNFQLYAFTFPSTPLKKEVINLKSSSTLSVG